MAKPVPIPILGTAVGQYPHPILIVISIDMMYFSVTITQQMKIMASRNQSRNAAWQRCRLIFLQPSYPK
jgi:hypothetical protein